MTLKYVKELVNWNQDRHDRQHPGRCEPEPIGHDCKRDDDDQRQREQPTAALSHHAQLERGAGHRYQHAAQQCGQFTTCREGRGNQRSHHEQRDGGIEVSGRRRQPAVDQQSLEVIGRGQAHQHRDCDRPDPEDEGK